MSVLAITGATGFVGRRTLALALEAGHSVRALTRRPQPPQAGVTWVQGALDTPDALADLVRGADAVIHIAGVVNAPTPEGFTRGNIDGTRAVLAAAEAAGVGRFVHVSSLAAREPGLSQYGRSKAGAEDAVRASPLAWTMVRPPAVYGPGDLEMLELFRAARFGVLPMPPAGRLSLIHVDDLARLLLALAGQDTGRAIYEPDDGTPGAWTHTGFARAIGTAVGRRVLPLSLPAGVLRLGARLDRLARGDKAKLTPDRAAYMAHPDWTSSPDTQPPEALWRPRIATADGLAATAAWYRANRLL
ncbi:MULTISPECIES: SDR family oxidoreductase [Sphingomonas]|uniref:SDR family oxidoreductase n=1 Tax=Sphingomonas TaxID=13687 RepID=UPI000F7E7D9E|nr:NAD(P)H-binding protein [Sphingomonas sp. ABOLF]RSV17885.1 NAD-dependent epimerase/dehydratase family protein [Sphingomonas sp. ABOLF]GLK20657.1 epimerase [Microbacterium terregens]